MEQSKEQLAVTEGNNNIPSQHDNPTGLHFRYKIQKVVGEECYYERRWININEFQGAFADIPADLKRRHILKEVDEDARYFVMRLDTGGKDINHIAACRIGIHAYADAIEPHIPQLAKDLKERYPLIQNLNQ